MVPSADLPQWLSLIRLTMAARWVAQSASQASIDCGCAPAAVVAVVDDPAVELVVEPAPAAAV